MAQVKLFRDPHSGRVALCPFAWNGKTHKATGPLQWLTPSEFRHSGSDAVNAALLEYHQRDPSIPSEVYQTMSESDRESFLLTHEQVIITWSKGSDLAKIWAGPVQSVELFCATLFPFERETFPEILTAAFESGLNDRASE